MLRRPALASSWWTRLFSPDFPKFECGKAISADDILECLEREGITEEEHLPTPWVSQGGDGTFSIEWVELGVFENAFF